MEIASHARAFAASSLRDSLLPPTAMTAMSIFAMGMVVYLFGGYADSPNEEPISTGADHLPDVHSQSRSDEKDMMSMNPRRNAIVAWGFSTWFAFLSPVIGILLGLFMSIFNLAKSRECIFNSLPQRENVWL
jgi:hypothetical protein